MARTARKLNDVWDYDVELVRVRDGEGVKAPGFFTKRMDTGQLIAPVSDHYKVVQTRDLVNTAEDAFRSANLDWERTIRATADGASVWAEYNFPNEVVNIPNVKVGDAMGMRLTLGNSFDKTQKASFALGMLRLVCSNGMVAMDKEFDFSKRHTGIINLGGIADGLSKALDSFRALRNEDNIFSRMAAVELTQEQGLNILQHMVKDKVVSEVVREGIAQVWNDPRHEEDSDRNLWNLLNAGTQHFTHQTSVADGRYLQANTLTQRFTKAVNRLAIPENRSELVLKVEAPKEEELVAVEA
tara:strand:+ start:3145 stop:4041 length:897 start_codon:yes stop_codon:yes gene_type:complete